MKQEIIHYSRAQKYVHGCDFAPLCWRGGEYLNGIHTVDFFLTSPCVQVILDFTIKEKLFKVYLTLNQS